MHSALLEWESSLFGYHVGDVAIAAADVGEQRKDQSAGTPKRRDVSVVVPQSEQYHDADRRAHDRGCLWIDT